MLSQRTILGDFENALYPFLDQTSVVETDVAFAVWQVFKRYCPDSRPVEQNFTGVTNVQPLHDNGHLGATLTAARREHFDIALLRGVGVAGTYEQGGEGSEDYRVSVARSH